MVWSIYGVNVEVWGQFWRVGKHKEEDQQRSGRLASFKDDEMLWDSRIVPNVKNTLPPVYNSPWNYTIKMFYAGEQFHK